MNQKWIDKLHHQLEKCKLIKNEYKRKQVCDRLFNLLSYFVIKSTIRLTLLI